jgi:3-deoxy-D-manno-octulosonic acid kinase
MPDMNTPSLTAIDPYHIGTNQNLSDHQLRQLINIFNRPYRSANTVLGGRSAVSVQTVAGIGSVVVKYYTRGGVIRHFVKRRYLRWGNIRSQAEFEMLHKINSLGVNAPKPIAYAYRGTMIYSAWLVTEEIKKHQTLAQLSLSDPDRAISLVSQVATHVGTLIGNNIHHVDLHPGNVLVDADSNIFLIDFDKARVRQRNRQKLQTKYIGRWKRAVFKHRLPEELWESFKTDLQKKV